MNEITTTPNLWFDPTNCFIGGHWLPTDARETLPLENPSDGTIIWANQAELEMLGYCSDEYIGHNISEFHADAPVLEDILNRLFRGDRIKEYEARLRAKDGSLRQVIIDSSALFEGGKFVHTRCFTRDISERKHAEELLRRSEERFRALVNASSDVVYHMSPDWSEMRQLDGKGFIAVQHEQHRIALGRRGCLGPGDIDSIGCAPF